MHHHNLVHKLEYLEEESMNLLEEVITSNSILPKLKVKMM
jgi:hypothetical protein